MNRRLEVNEPFLPPFEEYQKLLKGIWERRWLTNNGQLVRELEADLKTYLQVENLALVSSGTSALQIAINMFGLHGEIITTPYSYIATSSAIAWQNCQPKFVDINELDLNVDCSLIEDAITEHTEAILVTHIFGNACDIDHIDWIAKKHGLTVIYDAAHSFGCKYKGQSILNYGDASCISFHATKIFHCIEGGALVTGDSERNRLARLKRNFGHEGPYRFSAVGINAKESEFHAAMGLCNLNYVEQILEKRQTDAQRYKSKLGGLGLRFPQTIEQAEGNAAYFPVIFSSESDCTRVLEVLKENDIFARRYFYPVLSELDLFTKQRCEVAADMGRRTLCLPLFYGLQDFQIDRVCSTVGRTLA